MPAASEHDPLPALPHTWRPFGPRIAAVFFGLVLIGAFGYLWTSFDQQTKEAVNLFQRATVIALLLGALALLHAMARSRVIARESGLVLINGYRRREYEWAEVISFQMPPGAPWPRVDLADGSTISALGIHGSDGARARRAVRQVQRVLAAAET